MLPLVIWLRWHRSVSSTLKLFFSPVFYTLFFGRKSLCSHAYKEQGYARIPWGCPYKLFGILHKWFVYFLLFIYFVFIYSYQYGYVEIFILWVSNLVIYLVTQIIKPGHWWLSVLMSLWHIPIVVSLCTCLFQISLSYFLAL